MDEDYAIAFWQCVVRNCNSAEVRCFCLLDVKYNALSILSPLLLSLILPSGKYVQSKCLWVCKMKPEAWLSNVFEPLT